MSKDVGARVKHVDIDDPARVGTVKRIVGKPGVGGGRHARVQWDDGGTSVVRLDLLTEAVAAPKAQP